MGGWIGIDLDGTLAKYHGWRGPDEIGEPVPAMMAVVKQLLLDGNEVRIFTARASVHDMIPPIRAWLEKHGLGNLAITNVKDFSMLWLYDDRCSQVECNTGRIVGANRP